jgi:murein endopeptidase
MLVLLALLALLAGAAPAEAVAFPSDCRIPPSMLTAGSRAVGTPSNGRLVRGVPFPADTQFAFTWNLPGAFTPNPAFRRYGTEKLVLTLECVLSAYGARHPEDARVGVADLSLPRGGPFGRRYGGLGHASHRNGRDADVLFPRLDGCECPADVPEEVDTERAQELVDMFVRAGAQYVFVSPLLYERLLLWGPRAVVIPLRHHDSHMHVRVRR